MPTTIKDHLTLRTVDGGADLLAGELGQLPQVTVLKTLTASVTCRIDGELQDLYNCPLYSTAAIPLAGNPRDNGFLDPLHASTKEGFLSTLPHPLTFRIGAGREFAPTIARDLGWTNEPADWTVNLTETGTGWIAEIGPLYWTRRFGRLERLPWSTNPVVAEVVVRLAKIRSEHRVLDPFCGSGTLLLSANRQARPAELIGSDKRSVQIAHRNFAARNVSAELSTARAEQIQQPDRSIDRVVANLPFGKRVGSHHDNVRLYPAAVAEIARVLTTDGRAVLLTEDKRLLKDAVARTRGLKIVRERLLRFNGATPTAFVLIRTGGRRM
ncbi:TRM11 family SAM-dependent methyltransferase [Kribbella sp. NPDC049174]|uniref:TRM11 family SAM-dependent methyltransferase n=1 Tax=Kribbella sp. NPDC049174 TaxID=3364112 RepID=UPI00371510C7